MLANGSAPIIDPPVSRKSHILQGVQLTLHKDLAGCTDIWKAIEARSDHWVFQSHEWITAWYEEIGANEGISPRIVVGWCHDVPQLLIPLGLLQAGGLRRLTWLASSWNDYNAPIIAYNFDIPIDSKIITAFWKEITDLAGPADILELTKQTAYFATGRANNFQHPWSQPEDNASHARTLHDLKGRARLPMYGERTTSGFDRKLRKLGRQGDVEFVQLEDPTQASAAVASMLEWKREALSRRGGTNPFVNEAARNFLIRISGSGWPEVRVYALTLNANPVAVILCLLEGSSVIVYQLGFDKIQANTSPGQQALRKLAERVTAENFEALDFSFGDDPYKDALCDRRTELTRSILAIGVRGFFPAMILRQRLWLRRWAKSNPSLRNALLAINLKLKQLSSWRLNKDQTHTPRRLK